MRSVPLERLHDGVHVPVLGMTDGVIDRDRHRPPGRPRGQRRRKGGPIERSAAEQDHRVRRDGPAAGAADPPRELCVVVYNTTWVASFMSTRSTSSCASVTGAALKPRLHRPRAHPRNRDVCFIMISTPVRWRGGSRWCRAARTPPASRRVVGRSRAPSAPPSACCRS